MPALKSGLAAGRALWLRTQIATLRDEEGKPVGSTKLIEVHFQNGKLVRVSSEFGLGRK